MNFQDFQFKINNNLISEKYIPVSYKKQIIGKTVTIEDITKSGLYFVNFKGKSFSLKKKSLTPVISKKLFQQFKGLFLKSIYTDELLTSLPDTLIFTLTWFNLIIEFDNGFIFSKKAKKIGLKGIENILFPKIDAYSSNKKNNVQIKSNEIKLMLSIAEKYGFECIEKNNFDW
jgi:hypothetical protein